VNTAKAIVSEQCMQIRNLMKEGKSDAEIIKETGLTTRMYRRRKGKIYKEDKEIWDQVIFESLEHRALEVKKALEFCIKVNTEIAKDENALGKDRIEATKTLTEAQIALWHLILDGPRQTQEREVQKVIKSQFLNQKSKLIIGDKKALEVIDNAKQKLESKSAHIQ
jgi:hypothetical protein